MLAYKKHFSFIPVYILKVFKEEDCSYIDRFWNILLSLNVFCTTNIQLISKNTHLGVCLTTFFLFVSVDFKYNAYLQGLFVQNDCFLILTGLNLYLNSACLHQTCQFYSYLYSEGFQRGVCLYFHHNLINRAFYS